VTSDRDGNPPERRHARTRDMLTGSRCTAVCRFACSRAYGSTDVDPNFDAEGSVVLVFNATHINEHYGSLFTCV
jgi:hypothetical protein